MLSDVEKMVAVGLIWGTTNSLMRRGATLWDESLKSSPHKPQTLLGRARQWADLLLLWQYSLPFFVNLSASAAFFHVLSSSPISLAVPVTNATTFAATAVSAAVLGEEMDVGRAVAGTALIVVGVLICVF